MLHIERPLPGEWEGTLRPEDYGFGVIREVPLSQWETDERIADLYSRALDLTGTRISSLEPVVERVNRRRLTIAGLDLNPVQALLERHDVQYPYNCVFGEAQLTIDEGVFCPNFTRVSSLLLRAVDFREGERVLDAFAGSGAFGINAALRGAAQVVSVDVSEKAIDCIKHNARDNGVRIDARLGLMKDQIAKDEQFDLIIANPPLLPGEPEEGITAAVFDRGLQSTIDFIEQLSYTLDPDGRCYAVTSDIMERCEFSVPKICRKIGLRTAVVSSVDLGYEMYSVYKIERRRLRNLHWLLRK